MPELGTYGSVGEAVGDYRLDPAPSDWVGHPSRNQAILGVPVEGVLTSCFL